MPWAAGSKTRSARLWLARCGARAVKVEPLELAKQRVAAVSARAGEVKVAHTTRTIEIGTERFMTISFFPASVPPIIFS